MKIILTRNVMLKGKPFAQGETVDLPDAKAKYLVLIGKAEWPPEKREKAVSKAAEQSEKR
jgi:hypothetical protein